MSKGIQDSLLLDFGIRRGFRIYSYRIIQNSLLVKLGFRISIFSVFRNPRAAFQIPKLRILDSTSKNFPDPANRIPFRGEYFV